MLRYVVVSQNEPLAVVVGRNCKRVRTAAGVTQDVLAMHGRRGRQRTAGGQHVAVVAAGVAVDDGALAVTTGADRQGCAAVVVAGACRAGPVIAALDDVAAVGLQRVEQVRIGRGFRLRARSR